MNDSSNHSPDAHCKDDMAKQLGCFAAQQSCAAKSFLAFRHKLSTKCRQLERQNRELPKKFPVLHRLYVKGDSPVPLHNPPCKSGSGETRFVYSLNPGLFTACEQPRFLSASDYFSSRIKPRQTFPKKQSWLRFIQEPRLMTASLMMYASGPLPVPVEHFRTFI